MPEFQEFPKIARLSRPAIVTEKIDGTNAQVAIVELEGFPETDPNCVWQGDGLAIFAGSRKGWITPERDNFGFAAWVRDNAETLVQLGPGRHFGEWWGSGIQRGYGLPKGERRWSLFNTTRWHDFDGEAREFASADPRNPPKLTTALPAPLRTVPVLSITEFDLFTAMVDLDALRVFGSVAAPGFMRPEGVVVFHMSSGVAFKKTLDRDGMPKSAGG